MDAGLVADIWALGGVGMVTVAVSVLALWFGMGWWRLNQEKHRLESELIAASSLLPTLEHQLEQLRARSSAMEEELDMARDGRTEALREKAVAETRLEEIERQLIKAFEERNQAQAARDMAFTHKQAADQRVALANQQLVAMEARMRDWDAIKEQSLQVAKASVLEAGQHLSSKLLEDHKREAEEARKQQEETSQKTTQALTQEFQTILQTVASLRDQVSHSQGTVAKMWKALTVPSEAGHFSEIGLENTLKAYGLEPGRDYRMQYSVEGETANKLRPDAMVYLPQDTVMVIDSKASQFILQVSEAASDAERLEALKNLKSSMQRHLKSLAGKDYEQAVRAAYKQGNYAGQLRRVLNVMYLPSETALEKVRQADPDFAQQCLRANIVLAGPTGLAGLMALCRMEIQMAAQAENHEMIIHTVGELLERTAVALGKAQSVGKSLKQAAEQFGEFSASINKRVLPTAKKLGKLGIHATRHKELPKSLPSFSVMEESQLIEVEGDDGDDAQPMHYLPPTDHKEAA